MVDQPYEAHGTSRGSIPNGFPAAMFAEVECFICHVSIQHLSAALSAWTAACRTATLFAGYRAKTCFSGFVLPLFRLQATQSDQCLPEF